MTTSALDIRTKSVYEIDIRNAKIEIPETLIDLVKAEVDDFFPDTITFPAKISDELIERYPEEQRRVVYVTVVMKCVLHVDKNFNSYEPRLEVEAFFTHNPAKKIVKTIVGRKREFRIKELAKELRKLYLEQRRRAHALAEKKQLISRMEV
jgi:hypothetical protein